MDPDEVLDYVRDWAPLLLDGDTISSSTWVVPDGLTKGSDSHTATTATVWLSGGTAGTDYAVVNRIVTAGGRTHKKTLTFKIRAK